MTLSWVASLYLYRSVLQDWRSARHYRMPNIPESSKRHGRAVNAVTYQLSKHSGGSIPNACL